MGLVSYRSMTGPRIPAEWIRDDLTLWSALESESWSRHVESAEFTGRRV